MSPQSRGIPEPIKHHPTRPVDVAIIDLYHLLIQEKISLNRIVNSLLALRQTIFST